MHAHAVKSERSGPERNAPLMRPAAPQSEPLLQRTPASHEQIRAPTHTPVVRPTKAELGTTMRQMIGGPPTRESSHPGTAQVRKEPDVATSQKSNSASQQSKSVLTIAHETVYKAPGGTPNTRSIVGLGESVHFTGSAAGEWKHGIGEIVNDKPTSMYWTAPSVPADNVAIQLSADGQSVIANMQVVAPNEITAGNTRKVTVHKGRDGIGMEISFRYGPLDVCFAKIGTKEMHAPAEGVQGYFAKNAEDHEQQDTFGSVDLDNTSIDLAFMAFAKPQGTSLSWQKGSLYWNIPNHFGTVGDTGVGRWFFTVKQAFAIAEDGTHKVTKLGKEQSDKPKL